MLKELTLKNRSFGRFDEAFTVDINTLRHLVDLARLTPSGANLQPLKYILICKAEMTLVEEVRAGNTRYWRDGNGNHHIRKRELGEIILPLTSD